jgi:putative transposase
MNKPYLSISIQNFLDKNFSKITDHMTHISKNIYNATNYYHALYYQIQDKVYKEVFLIAKNNPKLYPIEENKLAIIKQEKKLLIQYKKDLLNIEKQITVLTKNIQEQTIKQNLLKNEIGEIQSNKIIKQLSIKNKPKKDIKNIKENIDEEDEDKNKSNILLMKLIHDTFDKHIEQYNIDYKIKVENNKIIYKELSKFLVNYKICNDNFYDIYNKCCLLVKNLIIFDEKNKKMVFEDVVFNILKSYYNKNFFSIKSKLLNHRPFNNEDKLFDNKFISQIKNNEYLFKKIKKTKELTWKQKLERYYTISSVKTIITSIVYHHLGDNLKYMQAKLSQQIINKTYMAIESYYAKINKGMKANKPKFLPKNGQFIVKFVKSIIVVKNNTIMLRLSPYIAKHFNEITNNNYIKFKDGNEYKYVDKRYLKQISNQKINKKFKDNNFIIENNFIEKSNKHIINASFITVQIPKFLKNKDICMAEIIPVYENSKIFNLSISYLNNPVEKKKFSKAISIDLGIKNLMTIYNPNGEQKIISGNYISKINKEANNKIDYNKSILKKVNNKDTSKKIRNVLIKRKNKINDYFNKIVNWIVKYYENIDTVILGYNEGWKNEVNMNKKNNREFYEIPFRTLINKLEGKLGKEGKSLIIQEESFTSKCDSLANEELCKHDNYLGNRKKRGLYSSSKNKLINADLNGSINIMRKYYERENLEFKLTGSKILNPEKVKVITNLYRKVVHDQRENSINTICKSIHGNAKSIQNVV